MSKKMTRSILMIITYTVLLALFLMKFDVFWGIFKSFLDAMKPFFYGFAIAFVLNRPCRWLNRVYSERLGEKAGAPLAVLSSYFGVILVIIALFSFILPQVGDSIRLFAGRMHEYVSNMQVWVNQLLGYFHAEGILKAIDFAGLDAYLEQFLDGMLGVVGGTMGELVVITGNVLSGVVTVVLAVVFSVYMLSGRETLLRQSRRLLYAYVPEPWAWRVRYVAAMSARTFTNFVSGQLIEACILGGLCATGMLFIQPDYAPLIGVIVGLSALIPVAGAYIGALLSAFLLLMVSPVRALIFLVFLVVLQQIEGNVIYPRVVGNSIGLPGLWVLVAVTVGGGLFGLIGIMLSVPLCSVLYTLLRMDVYRRLRKNQKDKEIG